MRVLTLISMAVAISVTGCAAQKNRDNEHQWNQDIQTQTRDDQIKTTEMKDRLRITVEERSLYGSGQATLSKPGQAVLDEIVPTLQKASDHRIEVDGYTDDVPYGQHSKGKYKNNWELSAARAAGVVAYLQKKGIDPARMTTVGHGQYSPLADNSKPEGRAANRHTIIDLIPNDNK
jgi:chemotaxis protein MotB